jgi:hypothetical protein
VGPCAAPAEVATPPPRGRPHAEEVTVRHPPRTTRTGVRRAQTGSGNRPHIGVRTPGQRTRGAGRRSPFALRAPVAARGGPRRGRRRCRLVARGARYGRDGHRTSRRRAPNVRAGPSRGITEGRRPRRPSPTSRRGEADARGGGPGPLCGWRAVRSRSVRLPPRDRDQPTTGGDGASSATARWSLRPPDAASFATQRVSTRCAGTHGSSDHETVACPHQGTGPRGASGETSPGHRRGPRSPR